MDKNNSRLQIGKPHNARPYDRPNQTIFGKVASKMKGLLNPSWLFNVLRTNQEDESCSSDLSEETQEAQNSDLQIEMQPRKRPRLKLVGSPVETKLSPQTWLQPGTSKQSSRNENLFHNVMQSSSKVSKTSVESNEQPIINGDDRSENSEGSASTSGCSSLVSSHKDRSNTACLRLNENDFQNLSGEQKAKTMFHYTRTNVTPHTVAERLNHSRNTSLWSCGTPSVQSPSRSPSVMQSTKPSFNLSTFGGPSKMHSSNNKSISPFYDGKTAYGGASSSRRMPISVAPYQVEKALRNQIHVKENHLGDNSECMSTAAKRILQTLEKMSTPIMDAKKIPNMYQSPVDLSKYLTPPSHCKSPYPSHSKQMSANLNKGPPIANINTITKLTTLKSLGHKRHETTMEIPFAERRNTYTRNDKKPTKNLYSLTSGVNLNKVGGGKMKSNLNQRLHLSSKTNDETDYAEDVSLPDIPLPITNLPTIDLGSKIFKTKKMVGEKDTHVLHNEKSAFTFSSPIVEQCLQNTSLNTSPTSDLGFEFSLPVPMHAENSVSEVVKMKEISISNENKETKKLYSGSVNDFLKTLADKSTADEPQDKQRHNEENEEKSKKAAIQRDEKSSIERQERTLDKTEPGKLFTTASSASQNLLKTSGFGEKFKPEYGSWECTSCMIRNKENDLKCVACDTPNLACHTSADKHIPKDNARNLQENEESKKEEKTPVRTSSSSFLVSLNNWECDTCLVRNSTDKSKCIACETLRPSKNNSGEKSLSAFKFSLPVQNSPIALKFGSHAFTNQETSVTSSLKFGIPSSTAFTTSNSDSQSKISESSFVSSGGFKVDTKISPAATNFGGLILTPVSTTTVIEGENTVHTTLDFMKEQKCDVTSSTEVTKDVVNSDSKTVSKSSSTTSNIKSGVTSEIPKTFSVQSSKSDKNDSETIDEMSRSFSGTRSHYIPKISQSFPLDTSEIKSTDSGFKTITTSSASVFGSFNEKSSSDLTGVPPQQKGSVSEKDISSVFEVAKNNSTFKFATPLPISLNKPVTTSFALPKKSEKTLFESIDTSNPVKTIVSNAKSNAMFSSASSIGTVNSIPNFTFSNTSSKTLSSIPTTDVVEPTESSVQFQSHTANTEAKLPVSVSFTTAITAPSFTFGNTQGLAPPTSLPGFSFFSNTSTNPPTKAAGNMFTFGASSSGTDQQKPGGFNFKSITEEKSNHVTANTPNYSFKQDSTSATPNTIAVTASVTSTPTLFKFGATSPAASGGGFVFGAPKTESQTSVPTPFVFGSTAVSSGSNPTFPVFQQNRPAASTVTSNFQFGSNVPASSAAAPPGFGTQNSAFTFGVKSNESANQMSTPTFGCTPAAPVFGATATSTSTFGKAADDKPQTSGFNFGSSSVGQSSVFRFGAPQEKKASAGTPSTSGFTFGANPAPETPNSFPSGSFSMNTPPSFNFGATSTPAGPFQFAASTENRANPSAAAPRRYRKAVRRGNRKE